MRTPIQQLQDLLRKAPKAIHTEDLLQTIGYTYVERERELIKESCIMAIMQWHEWDKTNYLDKYNHKKEGAKIWAEDYCKELYGEIEVPEPEDLSKDVKNTIFDEISSSQISDEEIQEYANEKYAEVKKLLPYSHFSIDNLESHFIDGMKFYREQLKNKL